jgi:hypothetical protein
MRRLNSTTGVMFLTIMVCLLRPAYAQVYSNKEVGKKKEPMIDSLKNSEYQYVLPILGKKATKAGYSLPYPAGVNVNYLWQKSDIIIENIQVGFNNGPMYDLSEVVRFDGATSTASAINIRPDIWLFPFLNIYGIFAKSSPSTEISAGVYIPDADGNWSRVMSLNPVANFEATTMGFGLTPTIGVGGGWLALDMNFSWSDIPELEKPAFASVFGPRIGKTFNVRKRERNFAFWVGGFRLHLNSSTTGSVQLNEILPDNDLQDRVDNGMIKVEENQVKVDEWWNGLTPAEQKNPGNAARYEGANRALASAGNVLEGLDQTLNDEQHASVQYSLEKRQADLWNFVVGTQYQHNKHLMVRLEYGFLGARTQVIAGLQYRFGF